MDNEKIWQVIPNPYTSGIPIENDEIFVGRELLIQEMHAAIKKDPVFILGHRRMGKTSLAKYIQRHYLLTDEYISIFQSAESMAFNSMNDFLFSFSRPIAGELLKKNIISKDQRNYYLTAIRTNGLIDFRVFFNDILFKISELGKILVMIIDDYPIIHEQVRNKKIDSQFISDLRGYMQNHSQEFRMIYTGASSLKYLKSQYSSNIMGVGKSIEVSFLSEKDVKELILKPLNNQLQFEDSAFQYLMELTNGQPFLVQVILNYLVDKLNREKKGSMIFKDAIEEGVNYFLDQAPHLNYEWNGALYSKNIKWSENEEKIAKVYKQLIISAINDNWYNLKAGLKLEELFSILENSLTDCHKTIRAIFDEVISILEGDEDILKQTNGFYFIKVGLFSEWIRSKMNLTFDKVLAESKNNLTK